MRTGTLAGRVRFACALCRLSLRSAMAERTAFAMQVVFMMLNNAIFFVFWWALLGRVDSIRGWRLNDVQVLYGVVAAGVGLAAVLGGGVRHLGRFIDDGSFDTLLTQPRHVLGYAAASRMQASGIGDVIFGLGFIAWAGHVTWHQWPAVAVAVLSSAIVFLATGVVYFSLGFWCGASETVARQLWDLVITFSLYPEPLFGSTLRVILFTIVPAGFVGYVPARVILAPSLGSTVGLAAAAAVYLGLALVVFDRGLRRYTSGSRFVTFG